MQEAFESFLEWIRAQDRPDQGKLDSLLRRLNERAGNSKRSISKRALLSYYMAMRRTSDDRALKADITEQEHDAILGILKAKPRRTASGVATVSVLAMPWPCQGTCLYCPSDVMMPKSYMSDEPACQRASRCFFDPYIQVVSRLSVLEDMGHSVDKVELIVLGGTFSDYPESYRRWFAAEMFSALNDFGTDEADRKMDDRKRIYRSYGLTETRETEDGATHDLQQAVNSGEVSYNDAVSSLHGSSLWTAVKRLSDEGDIDLNALHKANEGARARNVGLVFETRPDCATIEHLTHLRELGATKIQIGIQSLDDDILHASNRSDNVDDVERAMRNLREMGFKSHVHFMANLPNSCPQKDMDTWDMLVGDRRFMPDEVKVYPCALVREARLMDLYTQGKWRPYTDEELMGVLLHCLETSAPHMRISRMIRDICSQDIVAGNKHTNLRQMVERRAKGLGIDVKEIRYREIGTHDLPADDLLLSDEAYMTCNSEEHFLQYYCDTEGRIAAFCRLSLPEDEDFSMIRELHVYGGSISLGKSGGGAQHKGLGSKLIEHAKDIAKSAGRSRLMVISAVGTRPYYRNHGFSDDGLYQSMEIEA